MLKIEQPSAIRLFDSRGGISIEAEGTDSLRYLWHFQ